MADLAEIGFVAKTDDLDKAKSKLEALVPAGTKAEASAKSLTSTMEKTNSVFKQVTTGSLSLTGGLKGLLPILAGVGTAMAAAFGIRALINNIAQTADEIDNVSKAARKLGTSVTEMQGLGVAADMANSSFEGVSTAATKITVAMAKAERAGKGTQGVFHLLGLSAHELLQMPIDVRLETIADKLQKLGANSDDLLPILQQLGDRQGSLVALFEGGGDQIRQATDMVKRYGAALTDLQGQQVENMNDAWSSVKVAIGAVVTQLTAALAPIMTTIFLAMAEGFGAVAKGIADLLNGTSALIPILRQVAIAMAIAFSPLIIANIYGMVAAIVTLSISLGVQLVTAIRAATTALIAFSLSNPFTAIAFAITSLLALVYVFRDEISKVLGVDIGEAAKTGANYIIGAFVGGLNTISLVWSQLPSIIAGAAIGAANYAISAIAKMINFAIDGINSLVNAIPDWMRGGKLNGTIGKLDEGDAIANPFADNNAKVGLEMADRMKRAMSADWVGEFAKKMQGATAATNGMTGAAKGLGDALGGGGKGAGGGTKAAMTELQKITEEFTKLSAPFTQAGQAFDAAKSALDNGIITNDQYTASLSRIEAAFLKVGGTATQWGKIVSKNTDDVKTGLENLGKKTLDDLGNSFIDMALKGKVNFGDMAKSIIKDLLKMMWQALIVKPLLSWFSSFKFGGGGSFSGGANGNSQGAVGFASGGTFTNSVVNQPTLFKFANGTQLGEMGEAGPEAVMPLKRGSDGSLGVQVHGAAAGGQASRGGPNVQVNVINNADNTNVKHERSTNSSGDEIHTIMIDAVNREIASGGFDTSMGARFGSKVQKVTR